MSDNEIRHFPVTIDATQGKFVGKKRATLSLIIALAALAMSSYPFYRGYFHSGMQASTDNEAAIAGLTQGTQTLQTQMQDMQQTIASMQTAQQSMTALLQSSHEPQVTLHHLNFESARVNVQLAHSLLWQHQSPSRVSTQLNLVEDALQMAGPSAQDLLHQIQGLNTLVNSLPAIDVDAVSSKLDQLSQGLASLQFVPAITPNSADLSASVATQTQLSGWKTGLAHSWQQLKSFLIIRTDNQVGPNLVSESARFDAIRSLQLSIDQAKWDMITGNQHYAQDLDQLQTQVQSLTVNNPAQQAWLSQLQALRAIPAVYPSDKLQAVETGFDQVLSKFDHDLTH
ncbi:MAG: uroporphyrinogen-III C-methyltransferase [Gammaproteobacteria bacterium]|nr:uroporphyrinogen-III C-methyltransferase [Gammaproteobacteria bacterium]